MRYIFIILIILSQILLSDCKSKTSKPLPKALDGKLNLEEIDWNFKTDGIVFLDGQWDFYWMRLLYPEDFQSEAKPVKSATVTVPGSWNGTIINQETLSGEGFATYKLTIPIDQSQVGQTLALKISYAATASKVWVNGNFISEDGKVGMSRKDMEPHYNSQIHSFRAENPIEIVIQVSNFNHKKGGLWQSLYLGLEEDIIKQNSSALFYDFFLFGVLCIMTIYHIGLFILRREENTYLFFGLFCFIISVRILFTGETWITSLIPNINWDIQIKIEYTTFYVSTQVFAGFVFYLYSAEFKRKIWILMNIIGTTFVGIVILTPPLFFTQTLPYFQIFTLLCGFYSIYALILAIIRKRVGAIAACIGWTIFFIAIIGDIIINEMYGSSFLAPFGLFIFIFSQSFILSLIFSRTFQKTQSLSIHLKSTNLAYSRFVPADFITFLNREDITQVLLGDQTKTEMSVMFCDIRNFTALSETMKPEETFKFLNAYLKRVGPIIRKNNGFIDKFMGDGIMALFPLNPEDAVRSAVEMQETVREYNLIRQKANYKPIQIGIGIHVGSLMLGTIGEANRMDATVISDAVNLASRLEGLTKIYGAPILISDVTFQKIKNQEDYQYRMLGRVQVKGKKDSVGILEIIHDTSPEIADFKVTSKPMFERGIFYYLQKDFEAAANLFKNVAKANPQDKAAELFLSRCEFYLKHGISEDWEGVEVFEIK
ncbi:MAG TPA: 7TM diverse intracellular signaling domain-containing protein [Leptospiraceae bacterium]|nr:7TM diverse intracellular signaling domain-containing protein [Leptospiraceae bacterium]HMX35163.1 7TM diverse intracellular signaling domain-containing protein [Leptospiraceae bacterium]HMY30518.1 7TM diverse intracellular signaling domain-containing protein [Leptospiraceae bacterium]HMZ66278.1 7TM diverse intracellular signaling domain-containing protein [Leptospiraceae bacterium]HNA06525.1 7TM diverse intracellular signaling domain-containing protein [Leptospiraceae bacterium]